MWIAYAMDRIGDNHDEMWDEEDGFFYDVLRLLDGQAMRLKVRSLVGLLPLCASTVFEGDSVTRYPLLAELINLFRQRHPELVSQVAPTDKGFIGYKDRRLLSILTKKKLERVLAYMLLSSWNCRRTSRCSIPPAGTGRGIRDHRRKIKTDVRSGSARENECHGVRETLSRRAR
jgi:hypothetical protein